MDETAEPSCKVYWVTLDPETADLAVKRWEELRKCQGLLRGSKGGAFSVKSPLV